MHTLSASFILGYHGCDAVIAERMLKGERFLPSTNRYDWLGHGIYFWEANPKRGLEFAKELSSLSRGKSKIKTPTVVGAVINLGLCLDLTTSQGRDMVFAGYETLKKITSAKGEDMPTNSRDGLRRDLDCAVVNMVHQIIEEEKKTPVDTVRGIFMEGDPVYPGSGFYAKTHTQICVRTESCIKAVFRVPDRDLF